MIEVKEFNIGDLNIYVEELKPEDKETRFYTTFCQYMKLAKVNKEEIGNIVEERVIGQLLEAYGKLVLAESKDSYGEIEIKFLMSEELIFEWLMEDNRDLAREISQIGVGQYLHNLISFVE